MKTRIAASLALPDTDKCLETLRELAPNIGMAEIRLDLMDSFDLPRLISETPCPLIITCRPHREGGHFCGSETERLDILMQAMSLGCAYIDVEWDSIRLLAERRCSSTRLIASRHWMDYMPPQLGMFYEGLRRYADVVKLVGTARHPADLLPIFKFLQLATSPVIGIAMGEIGQLTRLLAPCFTHCLLTYAAPSLSEITATGQLTVNEMVDLFHLQSVGPHTAIHIHLCASAESVYAVIEQNSIGLPGEVLNVPLVVSTVEITEIVAGLKDCLPRLRLTADSLLLEKQRDFFANPLFSF